MAIWLWFVQIVFHCQTWWFVQQRGSRHTQRMAVVLGKISLKHQAASGEKLNCLLKVRSAWGIPLEAVANIATGSLLKARPFAIPKSSRLLCHCLQIWTVGPWVEPGSLSESGCPLATPKALSKKMLLHSSDLW